MAAAFKIDLIDGADLTKQTDPKTGLVSKSGSRKALVWGLGDGDPKTALARAMALVEAAYPAYTPYSAQHPDCLLRGHRAGGVEADSGAAAVFLSYSSYPLDGGSGGQGTAWTVDTSVREERVTTQLTTDGKAKVPLWLVWQDKKDKRNRIQRIATISLILTIKRHVFTAVLPWAKVQRLEAAVPGVNHLAWLGLPPGYWKFADLETGATVGSGFAHVTAVVETKTLEDWSEYVLSQDPHTGMYYADAAECKALSAKPYAFGVRAGNGIIRNGPYPVHDMPLAFGVKSLAEVRKTK